MTNDRDNNRHYRPTKVGYRNAIKVYEGLEAVAVSEAAEQLVELGYPAQPGETIKVFTGYFERTVYDNSDMVKSAISHGMSLLRAMRAVTLMRPGNAKAPSVYLLHYKPTIEQFEEFFQRSIRLDRRVKPTVYDHVVNELADLRNQFKELTDRVTSLEKGVHWQTRP